MEDLNQGTGYIYYQADIGKKRKIEDFQFVNYKDRARVFINENLLFIKYDLEVENKEQFELKELGVLVENLGRVNYSVKINAKGLWMT